MVRGASTKVQRIFNSSRQTDAMEKWIGKVVLVTGASSGIGAAITRSLAAKGMQVVGCARNIEPIQTLSEELSGAGGQIEAVKCDLTKEDDILKLFAVIEEKFGGVDVCINNAGLSFVAPLMTGETDKWKTILDVNVLAPSICARETIKSLRNRGRDEGHIIHINSIAGHYVMPPRAHFYSASKHALTALTEGLRNELRSTESNIRVSQISPGLTQTRMSFRSLGEEMAKELYSSHQCLQPGDVADAVVYALSAPPHVQVLDVIMEPTKQNP